MNCPWATASCINIPAHVAQMPRAKSLRGRQYRRAAHGQTLRMAGYGRSVMLLRVESLLSNQQELSVFAQKNKVPVIWVHTLCLGEQQLTVFAIKHKVPVITRQKKL